MKLEYPDHNISVYLTPISESDGSGRSGEQNAVARLVREAFGSDLEVRHHASGAPYVDADANISISHCRGMAALATVPRDTGIGIDIETLRPQLHRIAARVLSEAELACYSGDLDKLTEAWTLKEAAFKAAGEEGVDFRRDIRLPLTADESAVGLKTHTLYILERARRVGEIRLSIVYTQNQKI